MYLQNKGTVLPSGTASQALDVARQTSDSRRPVIYNIPRRRWTWSSAVNIDRWPSRVDHTRRPALYTERWAIGFDASRSAGLSSSAGSCNFWHANKLLFYAIFIIAGHRSL